jgi:ectoine hydroxylase-related dioxygenase (phytanoyl-CoA dioxygenase family)
MSSETATDEAYDVQEIRHGLESDGIIACRGAFSATWVQQVREDVDAAFEEARSREGGAVGRGPNRWYVEVYPEALRGFVELADHPWVRTVCETVLGPDYRFVEVGFDTPFPGATTQPWHRDFPSPPETRDERRLSTLAFNLTTVDTTDEMGPFEIAPGTHWDRGDDFDHGMFPPKSAYARYEELAVRKYPKVGDISARSALTVHRGTPNRSTVARPVLVLGVAAAEAEDDGHHDLAVSRGYWEQLPDRVRAHLRCPVLDVLPPITQKHDIEGLVMG